MSDEDDVKRLDDIRDQADRPATGNGEDRMSWPEGFSCNAGAVWYQPSPSKHDTEPKPVWICAEFKAIAETVDDHGGSWGLLLRWEDRAGHEHQWAMPRGQLHAVGNQIAVELEHAGLTVGTSQAAHELLKQLLSRIEVRQRKRCVGRPGWHETESGHVYVMAGGQTFGPGGDGIILQVNRADAVKAARVGGTLGDWQEQVARYAVSNHRMALLISAAFAPPLLNITKDPSGGLHLYGGSQTGKTTMLQCAASVWGCADTKHQLHTWRATANGLEGVAADCCDSLLPLDEIGMVDLGEAGGIVYSLANGTGKARADRDGSRLARRTWRLVFLSTGEVPLAVKVRERGISPMAGQEVRLANISADAGKGWGVFQDLHGFESGVALSRHLQKQTTTYFGTAAPAFLAKLVQDRADDPEALLAFIEAKCREFLEINVPTGADGQVFSVARRCALIAVAGELARMFDILPWPKGEAETAAASVFRSWLDERGGVGPAEDAQAISTVRRYLEQYGESRFIDETNEKQVVINRAGFRRLTNGVWQFLIFPEVWNTEICKGLNPSGVAKALLSVGHLVPGEVRNLAKKHRVPGIPNDARFYTVKASILEGDDQ